jgi:hypothetical protein
MEGFNLDDWEIGVDEGSYLYLYYKHEEGLKLYNARYWSPNEIYFEVYIKDEDDCHVCLGDGLTWDEALAIEVDDY